MPMGLLTFAALFYVAAEYEHVDRVEVGARECCALTHRSVYVRAFLHPGSPRAVRPVLRAGMGKYPAKETV